MLVLSCIFIMLSFLIMPQQKVGESLVIKITSYLLPKSSLNFFYLVVVPAYLEGVE